MMNSRVDANRAAMVLTSKHVGYQRFVKVDGEHMDFIEIVNLTTNRTVGWASDWRMAETLIEALEKP